MSLVRFTFATILTTVVFGLPTPEPEPTTSFQCPLEYPMKERNGEIRRCKPIGSPFCPDTHFCKMDNQQEPGICCLKNVLGKIQETETEMNKARRTEEETQATETGANKNCRPVELLPLKSPDCRYEQRKVLDSNGCPMPPTIVCTSEENDCPAISLPVISSLCKFGPSKNGSNGCPIAPDIICEQQGQPEAISSTARAPAQPPAQPPSGQQQPTPQPSAGAQPPSGPQQSPPQPSAGAQPPASAPAGPPPVPQSAGSPAPPPTSGGSQPPPPPPASGGPQSSQSPSPPPPPQQTASSSQPAGPTSAPPVPAQPVPTGSPPQQPQQTPLPPPPAQPASNQQQQQAVNGSQPAPAKPDQPQPAQPQPAPVNPVLSPSNSNETHSIVSQFASSFNETTEEPPRNFTFEEMLGNDFLHALNRTEMPQPTDFRKKFGPPMNASGKFHPCKIHADCFQFREPAEWCRPKNNIRWNEKSCFCATDTMTPSCIVERTDGDKTEWTFCSSFTDLKCT